MVITAKEIKQLKDIPNSGYENIKVEFLFHSNKIEGSTFTRENLEMYLSKQMVEGSHDVGDVYETINSTELFDFVVHTLDEPLNERLILEFHQMLKMNTLDYKRGFAGCWKKIPNTILGTGRELQIAQPYEVPDKIKELLLEWENSNKNFDAVLKFHIDFEKIHPFQDGNGRIGRFIILKQCIEHEIDLISIDEKYSKKYKESLYIAQTEDDYTKIRGIFNFCQELLDERLEFLDNTLDYLRTEQNQMNME